MQLTGWYADVSKTSPHLRDEGQLFPLSRSFSELEIQARWFAGEFGTEFVSTTGERIKLLQLGVWNREAGPDFAEAAISINGGEALKGSVELDPEARDWERHGHSINPDYEGVVLHVFWRRSPQEFFTRTAGNRCVPQVLLDIDAHEAPPTQPLAKPGRCSQLLQRLSESQAAQILEAASRFRMNKKAARLARLVEIHGADEALYQALAVTLGYKANQLPFALLAQRLPLAFLHKNRQEIEALLFGIAGFIDSTDLSLFDFETRSYLRSLWEHWWPRRIELQRIALGKADWRFNGLRPANDPHRRVAALVEMVKHWGQIRVLARSCEVSAIRKFFAGLGKTRAFPSRPSSAKSRQSGETHPECTEFWRFHYSFRSVRTEKSLALVGESRVNDMLANVFVPYAIFSDPTLWNSYKQLPSILSNRRAETAAIRLFGRACPFPNLLKKIVFQQGLLQIYEDFCRYDCSDCQRCPFPEQCSRLPYFGE